MPSPSTRRTFLKTLPLASTVLPLAAAEVIPRVRDDVPAAQTRNDFLAAAFDPARGVLEISRPGGRPLLTGAVARALGPADRWSTADARFRHAIDAVAVHDRLGTGTQLRVRSTDQERRLNAEWRVTLYDGQAAAFLECAWTNVSPVPITLLSVEPIATAASTVGALHWGAAERVLTNGPMYYDPGSVLDLGPAVTTPHRSWWNVGFFQGHQREGLVCGYVRNQSALGQVEVRRNPDGALGLVAQSILGPTFQLAPGATVQSEPFMIHIGPDPYSALEHYAETMGRLQAARVSSVINGWCDWFFAFEHITEDEMLRNAEFAARVLRPFGCQYIQVDEGYQRWHGDWEGNDRFPHGMKWLAERIRRLGLEPGIWIAPYVISEPTELFQKHPDWLLRHPDGRLRRVGPWPSEDTDWARNENPKRYGLDITHPEAAAWLTALFRKVAREWGYAMIKIDFVDWSLLTAPRYHDPSISRAAAYRRGFEIMRQSAGPDVHLQDCGPGPVSVGLLDSMRIELDQNYGFPRDAWKQYFLNPTSSAPAAAKRYYFHRRAWINDADHVCLNLLPLAQAQAAATLIGLTGGNVLSGDRLPDLDPTRLEILKKILPAAGDGARPVDLFDTDRHQVFAVRVRKPFGEWTVVGLFNRSESEPVTHRFPLERLWLEPTKTYLAYDFWQERFYGEVKGELESTVPPASVTLLALHAQRDTPQVVSTDRHILQGAVELEQVHWDGASETLSGVSLGPAGTAHNVAVYVPNPQPWLQGGPFLFRDFSGFTLKMMTDHLLRVRVRFEREPRVTWTIPFREFLPKP